MIHGAGSNVTTSIAPTRDPRQRVVSESSAGESAGESAGGIAPPAARRTVRKPARLVAQDMRIEHNLTVAFPFHHQVGETPRAPVQRAADGDRLAVIARRVRGRAFNHGDRSAIAASRLRRWCVVGHG